VADALGSLPDAEGRAIRLISLLQQIFESTYSFDLESLHKKGLKQAEKQLERYEGTNSYIVASTLQLGLAGHALPIDRAMHRTLQRLELLDDQPGVDGNPAGLEHLVPKARGPLFCELVSSLAQQYCWENHPNCSACPMRDVCPTGQSNLRNQSGAGRRPKPR
jgi:endonuclease III